MKDSVILNIPEDDVTGTSARTFFATDIAEQWLVTSEIGIDALNIDPSADAWLIQNRDALASVRRGLADAAEGKVKKVDLDNL
jgi:hypothetical protein